MMGLLKAATCRIRRLHRKALMSQSWTLIGKLVLVCIGITVVQNNLYGLLSCRFVFRQRSFKFSKPMAVYCFLVATTFGVFYLSHIWTEYSSGQIKQLDSIKIYCYMNVFAVLLNYVTQWVIMGDILEYLNTIPLFSTINFFNISVMSVLGSLMLTMLKMFGFPLLMMGTLLVYHSHRNPEHFWTITFKTMLPILLGNQLNNCFFGGILIANSLFTHINKLLREMMQEVNGLQTPVGLLLHKPFYRMNRFCELADRLDELLVRYATIAQFSKEYLVLTSFSLVLSLAINLFSTTAGCYMQYEALADYLLDKEEYDLPSALAHFVFVLVPFLEIILVARITQQELDAAKETGKLLQKMNLLHADVRFQQVVEAFWLEVSTLNLKLMPMGLLELDGSMVNKLYTTVAGFMLFLIQNDLNIRLSIK